MCLHHVFSCRLYFLQNSHTLGYRWGKDIYYLSGNIGKPCKMNSIMTIINGCPVSQKMWHAKELSVLSGHKCRAYVKICSPSPAMVTSSNEGKILQWNENKQTNKTKAYLFHHHLILTSFLLWTTWVFSSFLSFFFLDMTPTIFVSPWDLRYVLFSGT